VSRTMVHMGEVRDSRRSQFFYSVGPWKQSDHQASCFANRPSGPSPPLESNLGSVELLEESWSDTSAELSYLECITKHFRTTASTLLHSSSTRILSSQFRHSLPSALMFPPSKSRSLPLDYKPSLLLAELKVVLSSLPLQTLHCSIELWVYSSVLLRQSPNCSSAAPVYLLLANRDSFFFLYDIRTLQNHTEMSQGAQREKSGFIYIYIYE